MRDLSQLKPGERGVVQKLTAPGGLRRRFLDMGLIENTSVECVGKSPLGDPSAYYIRGAVLAIRARDGKTILLKEDGANERNG